jgi:hypothetical protein
MPNQRVKGTPNRLSWATSGRGLCFFIPRGGRPGVAEGDDGQQVEVGRNGPKASIQPSLPEIQICALYQRATALNESDDYREDPGSSRKRA